MLVRGRVGRRSGRGGFIAISYGVATEIEFPSPGLKPRLSRGRVKSTICPTCHIKVIFISPALRAVPLESQTMTQNERLLGRTAVAIHEQLLPRTSPGEYIELPIAAWQQCQVLHRKMRRSTQRGWQLAAERLQRDLRLAVGRLRDNLTELDRRLGPSNEESGRASINDIYADLVALHEEFEDVSVDRRKRAISVTTEAIELDGVYLGPFQIRLDWNDLSEGHPNNYRVIALDAHPAAANDSVTHPHVQDEAVCEGEGREPIRKALQQGRLLDFFMIVANLLRTYNSDGPFVSLADWHDVECADCGTMICEDERWTCENCAATVCGDCYDNCPGCDGNFCNECVTRCECCDENHCGDCIKPCSCCRAELCPNCLDKKERESNHDEETQEDRDEALVTS